MRIAHDVLCVFTQPDKPAGRGKVLTPTAVAQWASLNNLPIVKAHSALELQEHLSDIDCVVTVGYGILLPREILDIPTFGFINLHFSLLPQWRGAAPVQRAIENGDPLSGVTVFRLDEGMDTGPIYSTARFALDADITSDELLIELAQLGVETVEDALEKIERGIAPVAQSNDGSTRARKLTREEGRIDWNREASTVSAHIRAFTSNPGAWTTLRGRVIKVASPQVSDITLAPGEISFTDKKVFIGTATQALSIGVLTNQGKSQLDAASWANGARLVPGEHCE
jgi:methionyl-tRNA formyltransferase